MNKSILKTAREAEGIKKCDMCYLLGVSYPTLERYEGNVFDVNLGVIRNYFDVLNGLGLSVLGVGLTNFFAEKINLNLCNSEEEQ